jgi:hypothetical protein
MKLLDPLRHLFTYRRRSRYVLLVTTRQGDYSLALLMILHRGISYEVYNSMHQSREPVPFEHYSRALRYMFPRSVAAAQTAENRQLRAWAETTVEDELFARGVTAQAPTRDLQPSQRDTDEHLKSAIIALGGVGTDRASALAMEIHRGMERHHRDLP